MAIQSLDAVFDAMKRQVRDYYEEWQELHTRLGELLDGSTSDERAILAQAEEELASSIETFAQELAHPRITLAATGTTSSGKSSLVNLLCGAQIMPAAVQEMSAGTVIIDHDPHKRRLRIPLIEGLPSDFSGEWVDLPDYAFRTKLEQVMEAYRDLRKAAKEPAAPRFEILYPTRIGIEAACSGLPHGFRLRILDLPGLKYVADEHNKQVIRNEVRPALCLVTYNSEETDPTRQRDLLREVVDQVRDLGGSPARMLFVLNRIDVFRRHRDWQDQTQKHIENITLSIRSEIASALEEYSEAASRLQTQRLSTEPALYAYQALHRADEESLAALREIRSHYRSLVNEDDEPPGKLRSWSAHERTEVARLFWEASYGDQFDAVLRTHITEHLPQILLPHLLSSLKDCAGRGLTSADQITHAYQNTSDDLYSQECAHLAKVAIQLKELRNQSRQELLGILNIPDQSGDVIGGLRKIAGKLEQSYAMPIDKIVPLYDWFTELGNAIDRFLEAVAKAIEDDGKPNDSIVDALSSAQRMALVQVVDALRAADYEGAAGKFFKAESGKQQLQLEALNDAINKLGLALADDLGSVIKSVVDRETQRVVETLQVLLGKYAEKLIKRATEIAPNLYGLSIDPPSRLFEVRSNMILSFVLDGRFPIKKRSKEEVSYKEVLKGTKRRWYTLFLWKHDVYETVPEYKTRLWNEAVIPDLADLIGSFIDQAKRARPEREFVRWLHDQIEVFLRDLDKYQADLIDAYQKRLDEARNQAGVVHEQTLALWEGVGEQVVVLRKQLDLIKVE